MTENRNRREDLLKVAEYFYSGLRATRVRDIRAEVAWGRIMLILDLDLDSVSAAHYARTLFAELPAFLKAEWTRLREFEAGIHDSIGEEDEYGA